jgi:Fe-S-cluster containining protein
MIDAFLELRDIHRMLGEAESQLVEYLGVPICLPNCGKCCQVNVPPCTTIEAINMVSVLTGTRKLAPMLSIAEGWLLERDNRAPTYEGMPLGILKSVILEEYQTILRTQCPFLGPQKECLIWDVRPLTCRTWGVTRDNANACPRPLGKNESPTQMMVVDGTPIRQAIDAFKKRCEAKNKTWIISGLVPTVLYRAARPDKFRRLVHDNKIASAKLIGVEIETELMWQPQLDAMRRGVRLEAAIRAR